MDTSGSADVARFRVRALVFAGRADPEWQVEGARAAELAALLDAAPRTDALPPPPRLGYQGVRLVSATGEAWTVYAGVVVDEPPLPAARRLDAGRLLERIAIASAPAGALPEDCLEELRDRPTGRRR